MSELIRYPVAPGKWIEITWQGLVTEEEWQRIMTIIDLMKPGFVPAQRGGDPEAQG